MSLIRIAHSPDSDDHFLFWGIKRGLLALPEVEFSFETFDTQSLNSLSTHADYDVIAISAAAYRDCADNYIVLSSGASVGRNYGPVIATKVARTLASLNHSRIGIPGHSTTAALVLRSVLPEAELIPISISPYEEIFRALDTEEVEAVLLIHEGQLTYKNRFLHLVADLGKHWLQQTGLPLPLGINVISRKLPLPLRTKLSILFAESVRYSRQHELEILPELIDLNSKRGADLQTPEAVSQYLSMYANQDSEQVSADVKQALELLLKMKVEFC